MRYIFTAYITLGWDLFSFQHLENEVTILGLVGFLFLYFNKEPTVIWTAFSLLAATSCCFQDSPFAFSFQKFRLCLWYRFLLHLPYLRFDRVYWIYIFMSFTKFGKFSAIFFFKDFSTQPSFFSFSNFNDINVNITVFFFTVA